MIYTNRSQLARVATEGWIGENGYCLACLSDSIKPTAANTPARDFECSVCGHPYELKSSYRPFGAKVVDGAYASMMRRLESASVSSFLLLQYSATAPAVDVIAVHHSLITSEVIQERKPLAPTARRAGWIGCNILLHRIPPEGRIQLVKNSVPIPKMLTRAKFTATERLASKPLVNRTWTAALLCALHRLPDQSFTIEQAYSLEGELSRLYPDNRNIRPKIRQQLQLLRDAGLLVFASRGRYRLVYGR